MLAASEDSSSVTIPIAKAVPFSSNNEWVDLHESFIPLPIRARSEDFNESLLEPFYPSQFNLFMLKSWSSKRLTELLTPGMLVAKRAPSAFFSFFFSRKACLLYRHIEILGERSTACRRDYL